MKEILRKHHISFKNAFAGLIWVVKTQPNFKVHLTLASLVILLGYYFGISDLEMLILVFTIIFGLTAEMINTAIESVTDLVTSEWRTEAKIAKDVSAGMMLTVAIGVTIVAFIIFRPYLSALFVSSY